MCERQSLPCWTFVDSPCSQCASKCHKSHNRVKQYDGDRMDINDWRKKVNNVIINFTFTCLTANRSLGIVHLTVCWTHIIKVWSCAPWTTQLLKTLTACDRVPSLVPVTEINMYTPVPVQGYRCRECQEQLQPVVCDRWLHMLLLAVGLQTHCQYFIVGMKRCLTLNTNER